MGYIGAQPATNFETVRKQVSTTNSGTTITLDYSVSSVQDILVTVNAVVQSYDNYSVSGTTLTLGGTLNNDRVEILYVGRTFQTVTPAIGTVTNDMLVNSSITLNGSAVSLGSSATVGGTNTPMFRARLSANVNSTHQVNTKVTFNVEDYDTDSAFDTSNGRFTIPSGKSGKYAIYGGLIIRDYQQDGGHSWALSIIYKNGSAVMTSGWQFQGNYGAKTFKQVYSVFDCSVGDYFELYYYTVTSDSGNGEVLADSNGTYFGGHKLIT